MFYCSVYVEVCMYMSVHACVHLYYVEEVSANSIDIRHECHVLSHVEVHINYSPGIYCIFKPRS